MLKNRTILTDNAALKKYKVWGKWAFTDSNRRPSACKADALNQLS